MTTNILILAGGDDSLSDGFNDYPGYLEEIGRHSILERLFLNANKIQDREFALVVLEQASSKYAIPSIVSALDQSVRVVSLPGLTAGSACSALYAACQMDAMGGLIILSANEYVDVDYEKVIDFFSSQECDAGTIIFRSVHPRYSYVKVDDNGLVNKAVQHKPISSDATTGMFWFKNTGLFCSAAEESIRKGVTSAGKYYLAPVFNQLLLQKNRIGVYRIQNDQYYPLKDRSQVERFRILETK